MSNDKKPEKERQVSTTEWVERPIEVEPQPVSKRFIDAAQAAGARESLVEALRAGRKQVKT